MDKELEQQLTKVFDNYAMAFEVDGRYSPLQWVCEVMSIINTEREISFKAGRKKVVEWILSEGDWDCGYFIFGFAINQDIWDAKLKEWGI